MVPKKHAEEHYLSTHAPVSVFFSIEACVLPNYTKERELEITDWDWLSSLCI